MPKKGGKLRLCVDYRSLNSITKKNRAALPLIQEILDRLQSARFMTSIDLKDAYYSIGMKEGDEWKTAFRCRYGHFEFTVMPMGLVNAPATFQTYINEVLEGLVDVSCIAYLDDILIYSPDLETHQRHVIAVLQRLEREGLVVNVAKCEFHCEELGFLRFVVGRDGIRMEEKRVDAI